MQTAFAGTGPAFIDLHASNIAVDVYNTETTTTETASGLYLLGSIVNIFNPYRIDYEELPDPPNHRIEIELTWASVSGSSVVTLEEDGPSLGKGTIAIFPAF